MNDGSDELTRSSSSNHSPNLEENVFKIPDHFQENVESTASDHLLKFNDSVLKDSIIEFNNEESLKSDESIEKISVNEDNVINHDNENKNDNNTSLLDASGSELPQTTILLETQWGSKVYVVGTVHFSEESQEDVAKVIRAVHPNVVVLELCESRSFMLQWEENKVLKLAEKMDFKTVNKNIKMYGVLQGVMYLLLLSISAQITRELGMAPGGEFRRAYKEASNDSGCIVLLGDRPIEITLQRAFASMTWWQSIKFAFYIIFCSKTLDEEQIEKCKNQDYLEKMLGMFGGEFPELKKVFVNERDLFLSYSLTTASMLTKGPQGVIPNVVVGVVGMGHLAGIQRNWEKIDPVELSRVLQIPQPSITSKVIKFTMKASILCLALYGVHKLALRFKFYPSIFL